MLPLSHSSRANIRCLTEAHPRVGGLKTSTATITPVIRRGHTTVATVLPSLGATVVPCFFSSMPPVAQWAWEGWERGAGGGGMRTAALSHGRSPLGWDAPWLGVLAPHPGSWEAVAPQPSLWGPSASVSSLPSRILVAPLATRWVHLSQGRRRADPLGKGGLRRRVLMNHLGDTWPPLISSFCGKTTELIFIPVPDFKDRLCQALGIIGNKALFSSLRHVSVQSNKSHKGKKKCCILEILSFYKASHYLGAL